MEYNTYYGLFAPERGWVPAPRYLLRRQRVLELLADRPRGRFLEIGCGAGALLNDLVRIGYDCSALETSPVALALARDLNCHFPGIHLQSRPQTNWDGAFDVLGALEVLEHIKDDGAALAQWKAWLKPNGLLLLSVPAHPHRWNATDVWAGHVRRYRREDLKTLLADAGFLIIHWECYGFPLANILEPLRSRYHSRQLMGRVNRPEEKSKDVGNSLSGIDRSLEVRLFPLLSSWGGRSIMRIAFSLQKAFSKTEWGNGYLLLARKLS